PKPDLSVQASGNTFLLASPHLMVNTPTGSLFTNAMATITWSVSGAAPTMAAILSVRNKATNEDVVIDNALDLNKLSKQWKVNVPPGEYIFVINDGSGEKFSGTFKVIAGVQLSDNPSSPNDGVPAGSSPAVGPPPSPPSSPSPLSPPSPANKPSPNGGGPSNNSPAGNSAPSPGSQPTKPIGSTNTTAKAKASSASTISTSFFGLVGVIVFALVQFV
ncbi:9641_t:CDS:2, partial [Cetraspora pellucida]